MTPDERDRILIVDDDPSLRKTLANILKTYDVVPLTLGTGREALECAERDDAAVALIDLRLDDMSGLEVMQGLKQRLPDIECILVTGYASQDSAIAAVNLGAYSYVQKPYDVAQLVLTIRRALEKRATVRALRESEERYRSLVESSDYHIFILDREGKYLASNGCVRHAEADPSIVGSYLSDLFAPEAAELCRQQLARVFATGQTVTFEHAVTDGEDEAYHLDILYPLRRDDDIWAVGGISRDITERKRAEAERVRLTEDLLEARKLESVGRLAGGVAHDLNNMLTPILGYSALLADALAVGDPHRKDAEAILRAAERARDLVQRLLAFASKQIMTMKSLDLNELIASLEMALQDTLRKDIALELRLAPALSAVEGDADQIRQVILGLAANAQDAMPFGGTLVVQTADISLDTFDGEPPGGAKPGRYVAVSVSDTGMGMDKETLARIFEPFFTTKEFGKGSGLGLAAVYGIVRQHGGHVEVSSEPGQGTSVRMYFPQTNQEPAPPETRQHPERATETVVLVEEQEPVRALTSRILSQEGYTVLEAPDARTAISVSALHPGVIGLLITDVAPPDMAGSALYQHLASTRMGLRVLYTSGYSADAVTDRGVFEPGAGFLQKPFSPHALGDKVRAVLGQRFSRRP